VLEGARQLQSTANDLIFDSCSGLAFARTEVVELGTANGTLALHLNLRNTGRVDRENALHTLTVRNTTNSEVFINPSSLAANYDTGVNLDTLLVAFHYAGVDFDCIADIEGLEVGLELLGFDFLYDGHDNFK
jgi:hypothetical protein